MTVASTAKLPKLSKPLAKATALQLSMHVLGHSARAAPASLATPLGAAGGTSRLQAAVEMDVAGGSALRGALLAALTARGSSGEGVKKEPTAAGAAGEIEAEGRSRGDAGEIEAEIVLHALSAEEARAAARDGAKEEQRGVELGRGTVRLTGLRGEMARDRVPLRLTGAPAPAGTGEGSETASFAVLSLAPVALLEQLRADLRAYGTAPLANIAPALPPPTGLTLSVEVHRSILTLSLSPTLSLSLSVNRSRSRTLALTLAPTPRQVPATSSATSTPRPRPPPTAGPASSPPPRPLTRTLTLPLPLTLTLTLPLPLALALPLPLTPTANPYP